MDPDKRAEDRLAGLSHRDVLRIKINDIRWKKGHKKKPDLNMPGLDWKPK